jgi:tripartite-type tricarboxylate transporter receptor subunit TctC
MKRSKRVVTLTLVTALLLACATPGMAADFPNKPVNLIVAYAAGGSGDVVVRAMLDKFSQRLGGPAILVNKPGSGGLIGAEYVAKAKPDGYNILVLSLSHILRQAIDPKIPFNVIKDFEPVCFYVIQPLLILVKGDSKFRIVEELIDFARKHPGKLTMGNSGTGATSHFSGELFKATTKINFKMVPFEGEAKTNTALLGGHVDFAVMGYPIAMGNLASGDLRALATFEDERLPGLKDVPTLKERGFPEAIMYSWYGFVAPAGTPKEITEKLDLSMRVGIKDPGAQEILRKAGFREAYKDREELGQFMKYELDRFTKVAKTQGITVE